MGKKQEDISTTEYPFFSNGYLIYPDDSDYTATAKETAYLRLMDRARVRFLDQSPGFQSVKDMLKSYYAKLYSISAHFHGTAKVGETVTVQTGCKKATSHRAAVDQLISGEDGHTILTARAEIMFVTTDEQLIELPPAYKERDHVPFEHPKPQLPPLLFADLSNHRYEREYLISYEDTDMQGVVYNVSYVKIAHKALWDIYMEMLGTDRDYQSIRCEHLNVRFLNAARLNETIVVKAGYRPIDERRFGVDYRMIQKDSGAALTDIHIEYALD